jgi:Asp-tRNA(Asn)/Glu-tRNA(Gln) amidotransferase A subunit family amidase
MKDAFYSQTDKGKGGIILGKANLSEWAEFSLPRMP